jgi:hypothetical protein
MQIILIQQKNHQIKTLQYSERQIMDIFQSTIELERALSRYERDASTGKYYYQAIGYTAQILTYMEHNMKFKKDDPLFEFKLALHNLYGFMIIDQGKKMITYNSKEIINFLHEIVTAHRESRIKDRNDAIKELNQFLIDNLELHIDSTHISCTDFLCHFRKYTFNAYATQLFLR